MTLPLIEGETGLGESLARVLGLGGLSGDLLLLSGGGLLLLLGLGRLLLLLLLLGGDEDDGLLDESGLSDNGGNVRLVHDGVEETEGVGEGGAELGVEDLGESERERDGDEEIGEGDALSDEEGARGEGLLEVGEVGLSAGLGSLNGGLVVGTAGEARDPGAEGTDEVGVGPCSRFR